VIEMEKFFIIPENINVTVENKTVKVKGPKGELSKTFKYFFDIKIEKKDNKIIVISESDRKKVRAMIGTIIAHIRNMVDGVTEGFTLKMKVIYSHFPVTVKVEGNKVLINNFLGETLPRVANIVGDTKVQVNGQDITITGPSKDDVGQTCGNIEIACRISKYDRRIFQDGIYRLMEE
jgi:large subunit ribosomal protein L6